MPKVLLISGGSDSRYLYETIKFDRCYHVDYDREKAKAERAFLDSQKIGYTALEIDEIKGNEIKFYPARNLKLIMAVVEAEAGDCDIYFGMNASDEFPDNNKRYFRRLAFIMRKSYDRKIKIRTPLEKEKKKAIVKYLNEKKIPFIFCDTSPLDPCGKCHSCKEMFKLK